MTQQSHQRREVFSDFFVREERPDGSVRIPLGSASERTPDLLGLHDGEQVLLVMPNELQAEAHVESDSHNGRTYWYGILDSIDAIQDISPAAQPAAPLTNS